MIKTLINWFKNWKLKKEREKEFRNKIEELRKKDPFTYKH